MRKFFLLTVLLSSLLILAIAVAIFFERYLEKIKQDIVLQLEEEITEEFTYNLLSYSGLGTLRVQDASIVPQTEGRKFLASAQDLVLKFDVFSLLSGKALHSLRRIQLRSLDLDATLDTEKALESTLSDIISQWGERIPNNFTIDGDSFHGTFRFPRFVLSVADAALQIETDAEGNISSVVTMQLQIARDTHRSPFFSSNVRISFEGARSFDTLEGSIVFSDLQVFSSRVITQVISFEKEQNLISFVKGSESAPALLLEGSLNLEDQRWITSLTTNNLSLETLLLSSDTPSGLLQQFWEHHITSQLSIQSAETGPTYEGYLRIEGNEPSDPKLSGNFKGDFFVLFLEQLSYAHLDGEAEFTGSVQLAPLLLEGDLQLHKLKITSDMPAIDGTLHFRPSEQGILLEASLLRLQDALIYEFSAAVIPAEPGIVVDFSFYEDASLSHLFGGTLRVLDLAQMTAHVYIRESTFATFSNILAQFPLSFLPPSLTASLPIDIRLSLELVMHIEKNKQEVLLHELRLWEHRHKADTYALLSGSFSSSGATQIDRIEISIRDQVLKGEGRITLNEHLSVEGALASSSQSYTVEGDIFQNERIEIAIFEEDTIDHNVFIELFHDTQDGIMASVESTEFELPFWKGEDALFLSFRGSGVFLEEKWSIVIPRLLVATAQRESLLRFDASFTETGGSIKNIVLSGAHGPLEGYAHLFLGKTGIKSARLNLYGSSTQEDIVLDLRAEAQGISATLQSDKFALSRIAPGIPGYVDFALSATSNFSSLSGKMGYYYSDNLFVFAQSHISMSNAQLHISDFHGRYFDRHIEDGEVRISLDTHTIEGIFSYRNETSLTEGSRTRIQGKINEVSKTLYDIWDHSFSVNLHTSPLSSSGFTLFPDISIVKDQSFFHISDGSSSFFSLKLVDKAFRFQVAKKDLVSLHGGGYLGAQFLINLSIDAFDMGSIGPFSFGEFFTLYNGDMEGSLSISGSLTDPYFEGDLRLKEVRGDIKYSPVPVGPIHTVLRFQEKTIRVLPSYFANGEGYGLWEAEFQLNKLKLEKLWVQLQSEEDPGLHIRQPIDVLDVDGYVTGILEVSWEKDVGFDISGDIQPRNTLISLVEKRKIKRKINKIDLTVRAGKSVVFGWPKEGTPIIRGYVVPNEYVHILAHRPNDVSKDIKISGNLAIRGGELLYFNRLFLIREGNVDFDGANITFGPLLSLRAETRERRDGELVRIYLETNNSPVTELSPTFSSEPSLPNSEIVQLLGSNLYDGDQFSGYFQLSDAIVSTITHFGGIDIGFRKFESFVRETLHLDTFALRTSVLQNIARNAIVGISNQYSPTSELSYNFSQLLENTSVTLGRYIGNDVFAEFAVRLDASDTTIGQFSEISASAEFRMEFDTPFFFLEWFFFPSHTSEFFIPDNRFTLSWKVSY